MNNKNHFSKLLLIALMFVIGIGVYFFYSNGYFLKDQKFASQKKVLQEKYPEFSRYTLLDSPKQSLLMPNLKATKTLKTATQKSAFAHDMDPQGVTVVENYILISAYSRSHKYNSVIYLLNAKTGQLIKTIVLAGIPHVGGLTYDYLNKNIWLCTVTETGKAQVSAISLNTLKAYDFEKNEKAVSYSQSIDLGKISEASFISYHNKSLYIGFFDKTADGVLTRYDIQANGQFDIDFNQSIRIYSSARLSMPENLYPIDDEIQGITFYKDTIILSRSFGPKDSSILIYPYKNEDVDLDAKPLKEIKAPPYLEQTYSYSNKLYMLFESSTSIYRKRKDITVVDRLLQLDLKKVLDQ